MIDFQWELKQVVSGIRKGLLEKQVTFFLRPHDAIWGDNSTDFTQLADEIMALLPTQEQKRQFLSVCLAAYLLDPSKAPAAAPAWMETHLPISEIIGFQAALEDLLTWQWDRAAFPVLDNLGKNDTIYYALVAASPGESHSLMPLWISDVIAADAQDAVTIAAELASKTWPETGFFFWPFINQLKPTHDRSLGLPIYLSFLSVAGRANIPPIIATGEITLQGRLVPVQGVQHKCDKACEKQYKRFIYPEDGSQLEKRRDFKPVGVNSLEEATIEWGLKQRNDTDEQYADRQSRHTQADSESNNTAQTQAYFEDIQHHILSALRKAQTNIKIAVAWFTDPKIFNLLCQRQQAGVRVELIIIDDAINRKSAIQYSKLAVLGGFFLMVGSKKKSTAIMHNKFCVIDGETVITGSYNWSKQAQENWENITIIRGDTSLARQFTDEFESIRRQHASGDDSVDHGKVMSRLEALRVALELEDDDDIALQLEKLKKTLPVGGEYDQARMIINRVAKGQAAEVVNLINEFINARKQVTVYKSQELSELQLELKVLEIRVGAMQDEKADIEKRLHFFQFRYAIELGQLVREVLKLRLEKLKQQVAEGIKTADEYENAKRDYEQFNSDCAESEKYDVLKLSPELLQELKAKFRACSKLCHPDVVAPEHKKEAQLLFTQLNEANERNDLETITRIYENLQKGIFVAFSASVTDIQRLHCEIVRMRERVRELSQTIMQIRNSDTYKKLSGIEDWDSYFSETKMKFEKDKEALQVA